MDGTTQLAPDDRSGRPRRRGRMAAAGLVAAGLLAGGIIAGTQVAGAANSSSSTTAVTAAGSNQRRDPATMKHGPGETLLTGDTAAKVKAAALEAVPGGTVIRVETDSEGSPYEAHVRKSDGSFVTVKVNKNFEVTSTESGFGRGGPGAPGAPGAPSSTGSTRA